MGGSPNENYLFGKRSRRGISVDVSLEVELSLLLSVVDKAAWELIRGDVFSWCVTQQVSLKITN